MSGEFVHLHCHSEFSLLDGVGRLKDIIAAASDHGMGALALTDHGTMFGTIDFYSRAKDAGVKPIIGCEVYVADRSLAERPGPDAKNYHLVLLAENETGYRNLIALTTEAHVRGFYRKPRVDHELLAGHAEGLICLSGCASGELARAILEGDERKVLEVADFYRQVFPGRYYLELQENGLDFQADVNRGVIGVARSFGLPLVATNDVHYVQRRHSATQEILLCIQTQTTIDDPKRMRIASEELYLKSAMEMEALFAEVPEAVRNTLEVAERCNLELTFGRPQLPRFETPAGQSSEEYLRSLAAEGLEKRYGEPDDAVRARLEYEIDIIVNTGFVDYFLLVYDVIHFARTSGIAVGPGRGSAAGSLVAYCLFLTNIDPMAHGLSFERFLNPERVTMPDMDLDFADDRRDEVIRYVTEKYGRDRVAQIITFGTIGPRAGVRDVGRVLGLPFGDVDRVAKLIPPQWHSVAQAKEQVQELAALYRDDPSIARLLDTVEDLEGVARHASTHAAGVVIARDPLAQHVPLYKVPKNDQVVTQYPMAAIERLGLLKMDFLGLRTLTILERARAFIRQSTGRDLALDDIPVDDPSIYELLTAGDTFGVFQVDGDGFRKLLRELRPTEFNHIVAAGALYRPGPMEQIREFVARKNGVKKVAYGHPALQEVLAETYGIVVYQDQVMKLFSLVAGYSMGEADLVRRAMSKKKHEELAKHHSSFLDRAAERGTSREEAQHLWDIVEPFGGYAFNKAHAAAYAMITCQTAYLKANYPREYLAGYLSAERDNLEKVAEAMAECRRLRIAVLPPDINHSDLDFTLEEDGIRVGLGAAKHAGEGAVSAIIQARQQGGRFTSLEDFCARVDWTAVNKRVIESLARCGAFDSLSVDRARILSSLDRVVSFGTQLRRDASSSQVSLFGDIEAAKPVLQLAVTEPCTLEDRITWEEEILGLALSRHPAADVLDDPSSLRAQRVTDVVKGSESRAVSVAGVIRDLSTFNTRDGKPMAKMQVSDFSSSIEVVVFARVYEKCGSAIAPGNVVVVDGKIEASDGHMQLLADSLCPLSEAADRSLPAHASRPRDQRPEPVGTAPKSPRRLTISFQRTDDREGDLARLEAAYQALRCYRGNDEVEMWVIQNGRRLPVLLPCRTTRLCGELETELRRLLPGGSVGITDPREAQAA